VIYDSESKDSFSFHLPIYHPHHLQKFFLGEDSLLHKQPSEGFLLGDLRHEEFFRGNDKFIIRNPM
jgi:hypothetical protein